MPLFPDISLAGYARIASALILGLIGYRFLTSSPNSGRSRRLLEEQLAAKTPPKKTVIIIGAGFAGLAAARDLVEKGFSVIILEGLDRIGGRAWTFRASSLERASANTEDYNFEFGAQWLHGTEGHPLHLVARDFKLLEGKVRHPNVFRARFMRTSGKPVDEARVTKVLDWLDEITEEVAHEIDGSVWKHGLKDLDAFYRQRLEEKKRAEVGLARDADLEELDEELLRWKNLFDNVVTSADSGAEVSLDAFHEYHHLQGENTQIPQGYQKVAHLLAERLPEGTVRLNHTVSKIIYHPDGKAFPRVVCTNGAEFEAEHVICTLPLGVLKSEEQSLFDPPLPQAKRSAVGRLGFGVVDKLYLEFDQNYDSHRQGGFCLLWPPAPDTSSFTPRPWYRSIFGFYLVSTNSMVCWLSGEGARQMERTPEEELIRDLHKLLQEFLDPQAPAPRRILRANWFQNELFRGSYTYVSTSSSGADIETLAEPICESTSGVPRLLFAGEATHRHFYSTTHGAFSTGEREAQRIVSQYSSTKE